MSNTLRQEIQARNWRTATRFGLNDHECNRYDLDTWVCITRYFYFIGRRVLRLPISQ